MGYSKFWVCDKNSYFLKTKAKICITRTQSLNELCEVKLKAKALRHFKVNPGFKIDATFIAVQSSIYNVIFRHFSVTV